MSVNVDRLFTVCLLGGFAACVLLVPTAGVLGRLLRLPRLRLVPRIRLPHVRLRLRLPRLPRLRVARGARPVARPGAAPVPPSLQGPVLIPPGTVPVLFGLLTTFFGAAGLVCRNSLHLSPGRSVLLALFAAAAAAAAVALALWRYFLEGAGASEVRGRLLLGTTAHVTLAIPRDGVGAIAYVADGKRVTMPARSNNGGELAQKTAVMVVEVDGHAAVVERVR